MFDKIVEKLPDFVKALTFAHVFQLVILGLFAGLLYGAYIERQDIFDTIKVVSFGHANKTTIVASEETTKSVKQLVDRSELVNGLQLINVSLSRDTRTTVYFYSDRHDLQNMVDANVYNRVAPTPFLIVVEDNWNEEQKNFAIQNNLRMAQIVGAKFVCFDSKQTILARAVPEFTKISPVICSISIPPYAGHFSGYMNLFLTREPSAQELDDIRDAATALASDIFDHEQAGR